MTEEIYSIKKFTAWGKVQYRLIEVKGGGCYKEAVGYYDTKEEADKALKDAKRGVTVPPIQQEV